MLIPHLNSPSSGSNSPIIILNNVVTANSFSLRKAILSPLFTRKVTLSKTLTPSIVLLMESAKKISLPGSLSIEKLTNGYFREDAGISSIESLSISLRRAVACLDFDLFAEKRCTKLCSSLIFSSVFLF